ncbi:MAG: helicase C-terminal domain-containing protein, partial [Candidatus Thiodiazotropha sp.]
MERTDFDIFDTKLNKTRASRSQFPLKLAFALTVHKAQGQTIPHLEVDCFSFFAPGQLGVAIGRAVSLANLRVRNYNAENASLKHLPHVYEFSEKCIDQAVYLEDLTCCHPAGNRTTENNDPIPEKSLEKFPAAATMMNVASSVIDMPSCSDEAIFDLSGCPPPPGITVQQQQLFQFVNCIYSKLTSILPSDGKGKDAWSNAYRTFHKFLLSTEYRQLLCSMFQTSTVTPVGNRYATKLAFSVHSAMVAQRADAIKCAQSDPGKYPELGDFSNMTEAAKAKLRYIAGACLSHITTRLRSKALADVTNIVNTDRRRHVYKQQRLLSGLRISESAIVATTSDPGSLTEINSKQSLTRGLFHVPDSVFHFFLHLHSAASKHLSAAYFHMHGGKTYTMCRENVFDDAYLISLWSALFPVDDAN